jgi:23S rRNA (adenine2503-C2)-methyltransferase
VSCEASTAAPISLACPAIDAMLRAVKALPLLEPRVSARDRTAAVGAFGLSPSELTALGVSEATFARLQRPWLWDAGGPVVSGKVRDALATLGLEPPPLVESRRSSDGSTKVLLRLGADHVEAVHMPRAVSHPKVTLCISSQVGCAMGCGFCATASLGLERQLTAAEIVVQVLSLAHALGPRHPGELTLVFMGMGEPLHNLPEVARAISILCEPRGLGLSPRRITVSTSGLVPQIESLGALAPRPLLALSLNATTDATRRELMPIARRYSLADLQSVLTRYPLRPRERITIEYVLLSGVNDSDADAARLADYCAPFPHHINLIPFNPHPHSSFRAPSEARIEAFARIVLARRPTLLTVRRSRGRDVQAACGQLVEVVTRAPAEAHSGPPG